MKFNTESPVFQFLGSLADFTALNLIFLITCIPVITIGPAISALFSVTLREARREHGGMVRPYLQALKSNFRTSAVLFFFYLTAGGILLFNFAFWLNLSSAAANAALIILTLCTALYLLSLLYVFALDARFQNPIRRTMKNALLIALTNPAQTAFLAAIFVTAAGLLYITAVFRVFLLVFGFAFLAYCASFPLTKVFDMYED